MSPKKQTGLGKGFDALFPSNFDETLLIDANDRVQKLFISDIKPNDGQPRRAFDKVALDELAASIKRYGILQPLIVSPERDKKYSLVAGERRWRAAQIAGLSHVPAIVRKREELEQLEVALIENVQRVDLSPLEQAVSIERLHQQFNIPYKTIANRLGKALPTVHNTVRLLQLPPASREALQNSMITEGHARAVLALKDQPKLQAELLRLIIKDEWSVRQAEQFVIKSRQSTDSKMSTHQKIKSETPETKQLAKAIGTHVTLRRMAQGGKLEIHYRNEEQLHSLIQKLSKLAAGS